MASNEFLDYVATIAPVERVGLFQDAIETLLSTNNKAIEDTMDSLLMDSALAEPSIFLDVVESTLNEAMRGTVRQFAVTLDSESPLRMSTAVLKGLMALDNWDDVTTIASFCEVDECPEAVLADILGFITGFHSSDFLPYLMIVSPDLITRTATLCRAKARIVPLPSEDVVRLRAVSRSKRFVALGADTPIFSEAVRDLLPFGASFQALVAPYWDRVADLSLEKAIPEAVGFMLASQEEDTEVGEKAKAALQGWADEAVTNTVKISSMIDNLLKGVF